LEIQLDFDLDLRLDCPNPIGWHGQMIGLTGSAHRFQVDLVLDLSIGIGVAEGNGMMSGFGKAGTGTENGVVFGISGDTDGSCISFRIHPELEILRHALFEGRGNFICDNQRIEGFWGVPCFSGMNCCNGGSGSFWFARNTELLRLSSGLIGKTRTSD